jgi:ABC-type polar amino acid transport system ATPase subunit
MTGGPNGEHRERKQVVRPVQVLTDVSLEVSEAEVVVICGRPVPEKSTLLRCINRLEEVRSGR